MVAATSAIKIKDDTIHKGQFTDEMKEMADEVYTDQEAHNSNIEYASRDELSSFTSFGQSKSDADFKKK